MVILPYVLITRLIGACGNTKRVLITESSFSSGTIGSKSWPSAPSPCNQITQLSGADEPCSMMIGESAIKPFRKFSNYILLTNILPEGNEVAMVILPLLGSGYVFFFGRLFEPGWCNIQSNYPASLGCK